MTIKDFLNSKPLYYKNIDYTRMPRAYESVKERLSLPKIIHVVGTNGKGSTGRFLAYMLFKKGYKTGHYTSPHILRFNERIWINAKDIDDESLENAHKKLLNILPKEFQESLSYFEYTTLLAAVSFEGLDFAVMEAGLGGEFDATNVFDKELSLITAIDFDHQAFLGNSIEKIARTKIRSIRKKAILGYQKHNSVEEIAKEVAKEKECKLYMLDELLSEEEKSDIKEFISKKAYPIFFSENLSLAFAAGKVLGVSFKIEDCMDLQIFGRFQKVADNVVLDVGHNPLAAKAIERELMPDTVLVYNAYEDKDFKEVLKILKPKIKRVEIIDIKDERAVDKEELIKVLRELGIKFRDFKKIEKEEEYLVFGSFRVAEEFLKGGFSAS